MLFRSNKFGGDGFDLAWAVNTETGEPAAVDNVKFVRVYSSVLHNTGVFGETSPDLTWIKVTANRKTADVGESNGPEVLSVPDCGIDLEVSNSPEEVIDIDTVNGRHELVVYAPNSHVYVNETYGNDVVEKAVFENDTVNEELVRIIVQQKNSAKRPWIRTYRFIR